MSSALGSVVQFLRIQVTEMSKHPNLRVRVLLDGNVQESQESVLHGGVHEWREPFSFYADFSSRCEIHVLAKRTSFFCWSGGYKNICKTRLAGVGELLDARRNGVVKLPLFDWRADKNGAIMGSVTFSLADKPLAKDWSSTRGSNSPMVSGTVQTSPLSSSEKLEIQGRVSPPPRPDVPTPKSLPSPLASRWPSYFPPRSPSIRVPSPDVLTPQHVVIPPYPSTPESHSQLPQPATVSLPKESGVDQLPTAIQTVGHTSGETNGVLPPTGSAIKELTTPPLLKHEQEGLLRPSEITNFTGILCEPPENMGPSISVAPYLVAEPQATEPIVSIGSEAAAFSKINIIISSSSRSGSPLSPSSESASIRRSGPVPGLLHVNTEAGSQGLHGDCTLSSAQIGQSSPVTSSQPTASTTNTSGVSSLSPFSRSSLLDSPQTAATSPSLHSVDLSSPVKRPRKRPTIDTSCVGPRGQVRKHTVPPVTQPTKLRNASLDLARCEQSERFDYNPSLYSVAPSVSSRNFKMTGERCPSTQRPASRQDFTSSPRAPSIRREQLEFDDTQICLDTASLGDQEVAAFLREVDAALSAVTNRSGALHSGGHALLSVPSTSRGLSSRQNRWPSSQHLRVDFSASRHSRDDGEAVIRSTNAATNRSAHSDDMPSRYMTPLSSQVDGLPTLPAPNETHSSDLKPTFSTADSNPSKGPLIFVKNSDGKGAARLLSGSWSDSQPQGVVWVPSISVS